MAVLFEYLVNKQVEVSGTLVMRRSFNWMNIVWRDINFSFISLDHLSFSLIQKLALVS